MYKKQSPVKLTPTRQSKTPNRAANRSPISAAPKPYAIKNTYTNTNTNSDALEASKSLIMSTIDKSFAHDEETAVLLETIEQLSERQQLCSKTYQFKEAAEAKEKIKELKREVVMRKFKAIEERHQEEISQIMEAQDEELQKFNEFWDKKINQYDVEATNVEQHVLEKHGEDIETIKQDLTETLSLKLVKTPEQIQMMSMVDSLAKNEDYTEAEKLYKVVTNLEKQGLNKAKAEKEKKIKSVVSQLDNKQKLELNSLRQKIGSGKDKIVKMRDEEFEKLQQKFRNMIQEIEIVQQLEVSKFELAYRTYIPGEKLTLSAKKKPTLSACPSEASFLSASQSFTNLDKSMTTNEKKKLTESKNLTDLLCAKPVSNQTGLSASKHKRVISMQGGRLSHH